MSVAPLAYARGLDSGKPFAGTLRTAPNLAGHAPAGQAGNAMLAGLPVRLGSERRTFGCCRTRLRHTARVPRLGVLFAAYEPKIRGLPRRRPIDEFDLLRPSFRLQHDGRLEIYYAPMDWLRPTARIAIVGITPGKDTMLIAYQSAADGLAAGRTPASVLNEIKSKASFSGFRGLLVQWLDYLGVHRHLGLSGAAALWTAEGQRYLRPTSAIRYPVLIGGKNYSGRNPSIVRHPILERYV
jgi:hypothetical protein